MNKFNQGDHVQFEVNRRGHGKKVGVIEEVKRHRSGVLVYKIAVFDKSTHKTEFWRVPETDSSIKKTTLAKGSDAAQKIQNAIKEKEVKKDQADEKRGELLREVSRIGLKNVKVRINYRNAPQWTRIEGFNRTGVYPAGTFRRKAVAWRFILEVKDEAPTK